MSLARAFTVRRNKATATDADNKKSFLGRAASQRSPNSKPIVRSQISLPVELISTTNMLSYDAPDIIGTRRVANTQRVPSSSASSVSEASSSDESDRSSTSAHSNETAATSISGSIPGSPDSNHLSCYFKPTVDTSSPVDRSSQSTTVSSRQSFDSPQIPQRAPSHSKKAHVLSHKRSVQRMVGHTVHERETSRTSLDMFSIKETAQPVSHPFGNELAQLNEVAEELGSAVRDAEAEQDREVLRAQNLGHFCAVDYMAEISSFYATAFEQDAVNYQSMAWI